MGIPIKCFFLIVTLPQWFLFLMNTEHVSNDDADAAMKVWSEYSGMLWITVYTWITLRKESVPRVATKKRHAHMF